MQKYLTEPERSRILKFPKVDGAGTEPDPVLHGAGAENHWLRRVLVAMLPVLDLSIGAKSLSTSSFSNHKWVNSARMPRHDGVVRLERPS